MSSGALKNNSIKITLILACVHQVILHSAQNWLTSARTGHSWNSFRRKGEWRMKAANPMKVMRRNPRTTASESLVHRPRQSARSSSHVHHFLWDIVGVGL